MLEEFKKILKLQGLSGKEFAEMIGITYASYRSLTRSSNTKAPKWVKSFIVGYKLSKTSEDAKKIKVNL